jgi:glycosyltransferase involved in cell wall biosynthesis
MLSEYYSKKSAKCEELSGVKIYHFKSMLSFSRAFGLIVTPEIFAKAAIDIKEVDVVHLHELRNFPQLSAACFALRYRKPYVIHAHGTLPVNSHPQLKTVYDATILKSLVRKCKKMVAVNEVESKQFLAYGVPPEKINIIPNAIDPAEFSNLPAKGSFRARYSINSSDPVILYLGRIAPDKGLDVLVNAFALLIKKYTNAKLVVVGPDDHFLSTVKALVYSARLEQRVIFTGPLFGSAKIAAFQDSTIYVLPSIYETFPLSVLEAFMCSKPVISSNVGDMIKRVIPGVTGFVFKAGDVEELSTYLGYLIENPDVASKLGSAGRTLVLKNYTIDSVVEQVLTLYRQLSADGI